MALTRKGFKNQIKTLLWRNRSATSAAILSSATSNGGADIPATPLRTPRATTTGVFSSLSGSQAQLRQLADTAFLIQDFQTAASTLRTLAVDYRSEGLWHSYASVQVRLSVCSSECSLRHGTYAGLSCTLQHFAVCSTAVNPPCPCQTWLGAFSHQHMHRAATQC